MTEEQKNRYIEKVHNELRRRGVPDEKISMVINKTGFMEVIKLVPEMQLHYSVSDAVDEILLVAAMA